MKLTEIFPNQEQTRKLWMLRRERLDIERGYLKLSPEHYPTVEEVRSQHHIFPFMLLDNIEQVTFSEVYEGLIVSQPVLVVEQKLKEHFHFLTIETEHDPEGLTAKIFINISVIEEKDWFFLLKLLNLLGWFISTIAVHNNWEKTNYEKLLGYLNNQVPIVLQCEAKYDIEDVGSPNIPDIMYHATPSQNLPKIKKIGLVPKTKNNMLAYGDRIYVATQLCNLEHRLIPHLAAESKQRRWTIFAINTSREIRPTIRWFRDPNYSYGYYTKTNIPPTRLTLLKTLTTKAEQS